MVRSSPPKVLAGLVWAIVPTVAVRAHP